MKNRLTQLMAKAIQSLQAQEILPNIELPAWQIEHTRT